MFPGRYFPLGMRGGNQTEPEAWFEQGLGSTSPVSTFYLLPFDMAESTNHGGREGGGSDMQELTPERLRQMVTDDTKNPADARAHPHHPSAHQRLL